MKRANLNLSLSYDEELAQQMVDEFYSYPKAVEYVKKLGIPDEIVVKNISKIYDFLTDLKYCENCPGITNCRKENPTLCTKIIYENGTVDREIVLCKRALKKLEADSQFTVKDFDHEWLNANIASIDNVNHDSGRKELVKKITQYTQGKYEGWLYVYGGQNTGRSYVTAVLCNKLIAEKELGPIAFVNFPDKIKEISNNKYSKEKDKVEKMISLYSEVPVLVLDDFGTGYMTDYERDAIIMPILAKRAQKRLLTIFTSDYTIDEVTQLLTTNQNAGAIRAEQVRKILKALCVKEINLGNLSIY